MAPRGRGKFSKPSRGGGKRFSRDVQPVDKDGNRVGLWREPDDIASSDEDEDDDEDDESDSGSEDSVEEARGIPGSVPEIAMTREERRAAAKAKKQAAIARRNQVAAQPGDLPPSDDEDSNDDDDDDEDEDLPANPNHTAKSRSQLHKTASDAAAEKSIGGDPSQLSRREREAIEAQQARERYLKLHAEGKTDEARADLARLAIIREKREAERLRKEAEKEEKAELAREKAAAREKREEGKGKKKGLKKK